MQFGGDLLAAPASREAGIKLEQDGRRHQVMVMVVTRNIIIIIMIVVTRNIDITFCRVFHTPPDFPERCVWYPMFYNKFSLIRLNKLVMPHMMNTGQQSGDPASLGFMFLSV